MGEIKITDDLDAEWGVLGTLLLFPEDIAMLAERLKPAHFARDAHQTVYEAMLHLYEQRKDGGQFEVCDLLTRWQRLESVGGQFAYPGTYYRGSEYIGLLLNYAMSGSLEKFVARVIAVDTRKRLKQAGADTAKYALTEENIETAIIKAEATVHAIAAQEIPSGVVSISQVSTDFLAWLDRIPQGGAITGVPTGFHTIDQHIGGMQKSDLLILAGRPGMGKTSLALSLVKNSAKDYGRRGLVFSLEMSRDQLFQRLTADVARINLKRLRTGQVDGDELTRIIGVADMLAELPILIDHTPALSLMAMRSRIRRVMAREALDFIVVDYLQKMTATDDDGKRYRTEYQEVSEIARGLKDIAREFELPVLALSQLSRDVENRGGGHIPQLSDLRSTGAIEQEADIVMFIYRDDYYTGKNSTTPGVADILFAKHRNGETSELGDIQLGFEATQTRFYNLQSSRVIAGSVAYADNEGED